MTKVKWENVVLVLLVIVSGIVLTTLNVKNNNLRSEIATLEKEKEVLVQRVNDLRLEILELEMAHAKKQNEAQPKQDGD